MGRKRNIITEHNGDGEYLMRALGLDKIKKKEPIKKEKQVIVKKSPYDEYKEKKFEYQPGDFEIIDFGGKYGYGVRHIFWDRTTYITNENRFIPNQYQAVQFVKAYCEDAAKPYGQRGNLIIHLINIYN